MSGKPDVSDEPANSSTALLQYNSKSFYDDHTESITKNLSSLQFDAGVLEPGLNLLFLRKRSQLVTINIVSHAVFVCAILGEVKRKVCNFFNEQTRLKVGVIGCGRLGTHLVQALLQYTNLSPDDIKISTRRPDALLIDHQTTGLTCFYDNAIASSEVDVLFICCPPHQVSKVLKDVKKGELNPHCLVYSIVAGISSKKICEIIEHDLVLKPSYSYREEAYLNENEWNYGGGVVNSLAMNNFKQLTCPIRRKEFGISIVQVDDNFLRSIFLQMLNVSMYYNATFNVQQSVEISNFILFRGMSGFSLDVVDYEKLLNDGGYFRIDASEIVTKGLMSLEDSPEFVKNFEKHYKMIFDRSVDWTDY